MIIISELMLGRVNWNRYVYKWAFEWQNVEKQTKEEKLRMRMRRFAVIGVAKPVAALNTMVKENAEGRRKRRGGKISNLVTFECKWIGLERGIACVFCQNCCWHCEIVVARLTASTQTQLKRIEWTKQNYGMCLFIAAARLDRVN